APPTSQRDTMPLGVAKSEAERPAALPPTPAMETWPVGAPPPPALISAAVICQRPSAVRPLRPTPALEAISATAQPPLARPDTPLAMPAVWAQRVRAVMARLESAWASASRADCSGVTPLPAAPPALGSGAARQYWLSATAPRSPTTSNERRTERR